MSDEADQNFRDEWQTRLYETAYRMAVSLKELHDSNPWPDEHPVLQVAINTLATELWDHNFSVAEIQAALEEASSDLPRYAAGEPGR